MIASYRVVAFAIGVTFRRILSVATGKLDGAKDHIFSCVLSPSKRGLKLVVLSKSRQWHYQTFKSLSIRFGVSVMSIFIFTVPNKLRASSSSNRQNNNRSGILPPLYILTCLIFTTSLEVCSKEEVFCQDCFFSTFSLVKVYLFLFKFSFFQNSFFLPTFEILHLWKYIYLC